METTFLLFERKTVLLFKFITKKGYVDVVFWVSAHLTKYNEYLITENRKVVKSLRYSSVDAIKEEILLAILEEAHQLKDKGFYKKK